MSITVKAKRAILAKLVAKRNPFLLRLPTAGLLVRTEYNFDSAGLSPGTIVGIIRPNDWFEVGQISTEHFDMKCSTFIYHISVMYRLTQIAGNHQLQVPCDKISCVFKVVHG